MPLVIILPWPARELHPNSRGHWSARSKAAKKARADAGWAAREAGLKPMTAHALSVTAVFYPPDNRRRDTDGMLSSIKSYFDGIADVVSVDDSRWNIFVKRKEYRKLGAVEIFVETAS